MTLQNTGTTTSTTTATSMTDIDTGYLNAKDAYALDQYLFENGYTLEQLMELAGLAVAEAVFNCLPSKPTSSTDAVPDKRRVLIACGPGNNGGDGLVAARHLALFGYDVSVVYPKRSKREEHYSKLVMQCEDIGVQFVDEMVTNKKYDAVVDAIFGFSFSGVPREPFASIINDMMKMQKENSTLIISVDVPSGWNVDEGDTANSGLCPDVLISLTAPKLCSEQFKGRHFVGGRFLPPAVATEYGIKMPPYPGVQQVMEICKNKRQGPLQTDSNDDWEAQYEAYCIEKEKSIAAKDKEQTSNDSSFPHSTEGGEEWALQYHNYCVNKETEVAEEEKRQKKEGLNSNSNDDTGDWEADYAKYLTKKEREGKH